MERSHIFDSSILKACDIRGVVGEKLNEVDAYFVGKAFGTFLQRDKKSRSCVVGRDGRRSSKKFSDKVIKGLLETGINVTNIGLMPTPVVYFSVKHLNLDAGLIVTASHNPPEYNGFKMLTNDDPVYGGDIQKIAEYSKNGDFCSGKGTLSNVDIKPDYLNFLFRKIKPQRNPLKVVWDCGNGADSVLLNDVIAKLPGNHKALFTDIDSDFKNHLADPSDPNNMVALQKEVIRSKYDIGIAFDGDGDRLGIVDSEGYIFFGDQLLIIYERDFLKHHKGEKVMCEVKASKVLYDDIKKNGGIGVMWKPGHSSQKAKMKSDKIMLAGETSGHMYFGENYNFDDALYAAVKLLNILGNEDKSITQMRKEFPVPYSTPEIRFDVVDSMLRSQVPIQIADRMKKSKRQFIDIDGVKAETEDGWWLVRSSNTQPALTLRCEALTENGLNLCKSEVEYQLKLSGVDFKF